MQSPPLNEVQRFKQAKEIILRSSSRIDRAKGPAATECGCATDFLMMFAHRCPIIVGNEANFPLAVGGLGAHLPADVFINPIHRFSVARVEVLAPNLCFLR